MSTRVRTSQGGFHRLCDAPADGAPISGASVVAGIAASTLGEWCERHNELEQRIAESGEMARQIALRAIKAAEEKALASARQLLLQGVALFRSGGCAGSIRCPGSCAGRSR